ncbi:MAG: methyltransferase domain-containing protein [Patescibacteria group bacterium]|jgi:SAM-dependent methyltransferase|nr:methyltransferase domain-containing protein [Patescibacteria group bacterium]
MNWKIEIPRENYYSKMYDIEELTSLNKKAHRNSSELVAKIEKKIKNNKCTNAIKEIEKISRPNTKLEMLYGALKIKNLILQNKNLSPKKSALLELSKYFKKHTQTIKNKMLVEKPVAEDWKRISPDVNDEDSIVNFYIKTDSYIYELMAANHIIQTLFSYYVLSKKIENKNIKNILDYGAGAGTLCILFKKLGYEITYADLPGKLFDYAKWRFKERCLKVPMINITKGKISKKYDCIISTEVVEHVLRPKDLIQELKKMLKKNGILIISESCSYTKEFSTHLESNKIFGGEKFIKTMNEIGFKQINKNPFIPQLIFEKND